MAHEKYEPCIEACEICAAECEHCATACLGEENVKMMARCIQLDRTCADVCSLAAREMARGSEFAERICGLCAEICEACAAECAKHQADHCQRCAQACRDCAEECRNMAESGEEAETPAAERI
ncbi:four-helix bundle copper-binding protein [Opitutaceae bacterium EW11]|nr:four-helix bundle copper-binding protein [Opitutaceae bacterium EW11]